MNVKKRKTLIIFILLVILCIISIAYPIRKTIAYSRFGGSDGHDYMNVRNANDLYSNHELLCIARGYQIIGSTTDGDFHTGTYERKNKIDIEGAKATSGR